MGAAKARGTYEHRKALAIVKAKADKELKEQQEQAAWDAMTDQEKEEHYRKQSLLVYTRIKYFKELPMPEYQLSKLDLCNPSYFNGHHKPVLQTVVWREMTKQELTDAIVSEYHSLWDHLCESPKFPWPDLTDEELTRMCDEFIITEHPFEKTGIDTLEECQHNDSSESCYLFIICEGNDD
jgi:hypothetical protein